MRRASSHDWLCVLAIPLFSDFDPEPAFRRSRLERSSSPASVIPRDDRIVQRRLHGVALVLCRITHARALGKALFPLKVAECEIHPLLRTVQVIDLTERREEGLDRLSRGSRQQDSIRRTASPGRESPSLSGAAAFEEADAAVFFGRENEIRDALDALGGQRRFGGARFMLLLGVSGSGKSSLLRAGILAVYAAIVPNGYRAALPGAGPPLESLAYARAAASRRQANSASGGSSTASWQPHRPAMRLRGLAES